MQPYFPRDIPHIDPFTVVESTKGKDSIQLKIKGLDSPDFIIEGKSKKPLSARFKKRFVKVSVQNKTAYLDIADISRKCGITPKEVLRTDQKGGILTFIEGRFKYLSVKDKCDRIEKFCENYFKKESDKREFKSKLRAEVIKFEEIKNRDEALELEFRGDTYQVQYDETENRVIEVYRLGEKIGAGALSAAYKIEKLREGAVFALKVPANPHDKEEREKSLKDIYEERNILRMLHGDEGRPILGIMEIGMEVLNFKNLGHGVMNKYYPLDGDDILHDQVLKKDNEVSVERFICCRSLIYGLNHAMHKGILHLDSKPSNVFVSFSDEGFYKYHLADWGGAKEIEGYREDIIAYLEGQEEKLPFIVMTDEFTCFEDQKTEAELEDKFQEMRKQVKSGLMSKDDYLKVVDEFIHWREKMAVYHLAATLFEMLIGDEIHPEKEEGWVALKDSGCAPELIDLLKQMTKPNYQERISIEQALESIDKIISKNPELSEACAQI